MNNFLISDWVNIGEYSSSTFSQGTVLQTELDYKDAYEMYEVFILLCYKNGNMIKADDFAKFLNDQGIAANILYLHKEQLTCSEIEDNLAVEIQAL